MDNVSVIGIVGRRRRGKTTLARSIRDSRVTEIYDEVKNLPTEKILYARHRNVLVIWTSNWIDNINPTVLENTDVIYYDVTIPESWKARIREKLRTEIDRTITPKTEFIVVSKESRNLRD